MRKIEKIFNSNNKSLDKEIDSIELITKKQVYCYNDPRIRYFVPFIKYYSYDKIKVNVVINHSAPCYATELFEKYYEFDSRFGLLTDFILSWASIRGILNEFKGYLSSYAMILLIIFFLQILEVPVLEPIQQYAIATNTKTHVRIIPSFQSILLGTEKHITEPNEILIDTSYKTINIKKMKDHLGYPKNNKSIGELLTLFYYYFAFDYSVSSI